MFENNENKNTNLLSDHNCSENDGLGSYFYFSSDTPMLYDSIPNNIADYQYPLENIEPIKQIIINNDVILFFKGVFNQNSLLNLLSTVESEFENHTNLSKIYNLMVELLQNISKHADNFTEEINFKPGIFLVAKVRENFVLLSCNYVKNNKINDIKTKIDTVNNLDIGDLIKEYNKILQNFDIKHKKGLGLLDLRKKSKSHLDYYFHNINDKLSILIMQVTLKKQHRLLDALIIEATKESPRIHFDPTNNIFEISSKSLPEDAEEFYMPVINWLQEYSFNPNDTTNFTFKLEYYNTSSARFIVKIIDILKKINSKNKVQIYWYYRDFDEDMMANGQDLKSMFKELNMELIEYQ